jgi:hypothetical protein
MNNDYFEIQLSSSDIDDVYDALIDIGKKELRQFESKVYSFLDHQETDIRRAAIKVLGCYWNVEGFDDTLHNIWKNDQDDDVRLTALICWIGYFLDTKSPNIARELKVLAKDGQEDKFMRLEALRGIVNVLGASEDDINFNELKRISGYKAFEESIPWKKIDNIFSSHGIAV